MKKREGNRKDWIKNILIIFLVILLILTFFSNTIMNYSLAEVSSTYITSGSISTAIRGSGVVQSVDPYNVTITEGRKVESVNVKKGDIVTKGDVLFVLEEGDSTEVADAKKAYQTLLDNYQTAIIDNKISQEVVNAAEKRDADALSQKVTLLEQRAAVVQQKKDAVDNIDSQLSVLNVELVDTTAEEAQLEKAQENLDAANKVLAKYNELDAKVINLLNEAKNAADENEGRTLILQAVDAADERDELGTKEDLEAEVSKYQKQIDEINKVIDDKKAAPSEEAAQLTYERAVANNEYNQAQNSYEELYNEIKYQRQLQDMLDEIDEAKAAYEKLEAKAVGTEVVAPVSGTITAVNVVAGETVAAQATMAVIQLTGKEYTLEMTVTKEQAARVKVGDVGQASNSWYYSDMVLTVSAIKNDTSNPSSGNRIIVFTVTGSDINVGQSVSVSVGDKSANYDMIVPNTAIREDKNGTYILIIKSKSTPLGNRYTAERVDVTKLASDSTNTAISCALQGYESVITTATKPVSAGDLVRLPK